MEALCFRVSMLRSISTTLPFSANAVVNASISKRSDFSSRWVDASINAQNSSVSVVSLGTPGRSIRMESALSMPSMYLMRWVFDMGQAFGDPT